ncbi:MAG TPA: FAD-dependent oxidoreductase, partial [Solirubrobacterales bacterium]|nr:FAD-dependent oxidoreductase [Solirubrobacterales bacterium]
MSDRGSYDAVIVGGGAIGLCCAWSAARRGARVVVLDRAEPPAGATRVAAGMLAPIGELAFGEPELLRMTLAAAERYPSFVAELEDASGMGSGYARHGALHVALDRDEAAALRRIHDLQRSLGLGAEWLPPRRCRELEPGLTPSFNGGVHAPEEAAIDPRRMSAALLAALEAEGVEVRNGVEVEDALLDGERIEGVRSASGEEWHAGAVVLAAGAWSGTATWLPGEARPPVRPVKGQILTLRGPARGRVSERIVVSERMYAVPRADGRLIVGATVEEMG